ncbi:MAG: hypothetical protein M1825_001849 [Sarcosagium campestre]|nr:MAG: hypothetical protein M1825_001849 [Sarcosagium campestre]
MAMAVDNQQRHLGSSLGFEHMQPYASQPSFSDPWAASSSASSSSQLFPTSIPSSGLSLDAISRQSAAMRQSTMSMPYNAIAAPAPTSSLGNGLPFRLGQDLQSLSQDLLGAQRMTNSTSYGSESSYSSAPSPSNVSYAATSAPYEAVSYPQSRNSPFLSQATSGDRRLSQQPPLVSNGFVAVGSAPQRQRETAMTEFGSDLTAHQSRESFGDALDAGRGMVAMSQDITPRNIYGPRSSRGSTDSYGFPSTHSSTSSISSANSYPSYYGSVDSSVTDYSSNSDMDMPSRTLPRPQGLLAGSMPPAPQSMMGQFSSKVSSNTQKKHKCKVCDKRFTRPSSLQTHMYSHTGEKPFACDVDGCSRHFSVVSNLRRHRKVHKGERDVSPDAE